MIFQNFLLGFLFFMNYCFAWQVIPQQLPKEEAEQKQVRDSSRSFSFPINAYLGLADRLFVTAKENNRSQKFSLSLYDFLENVFKPVAFEKVILNGEADQKNPLFDCAIDHIAIMDERAFVVSMPSEPKKLFAVTLQDFKEVLSSSNIKDCLGCDIDSPIIALAGGQNRAFVAIKGKGETVFGNGASGIAVFGVHEETKEVELTSDEFEKLKKEIQERGDEQLIERFTKEITVKDGKHTRKVIEKKFLQIGTAPITTSSEFIKIGAEVSVIEIADMYWNTNLKRLFVAFSVKSNDGEADGAYGLTVGRINEKGALEFSPIMPPALGTQDQNQIVAGKGGHAQTSIHKVRSMLTTTLLDYMIVLGGNGSVSETQRTVFALPVLNFHMEDGIAPECIALQGTLADKLGKPFEGFSNKGRAHLFLGRHFINAPKSAADLCTNESKSAQIGGGALEIGPIDEIFIKNDAVFAIVSQPFEGKAAGIYYSQAIFDEQGRIAAWTSWQPKALTPDETITNGYIDRINGSLVVASGNDQDSIRTIKRTQWKNDELTELVKQEFPKANGGVQGLIDFPANTPGLNQASLIVTGFAKLLFVQMGEQLQTMAFKDEALQKLGPISCAEIVYNNPFSWLIAGGVNGLAILNKEDGFDVLNPDKMSKFKNIGDYRFVRKIIADEQFLYILTDTSFDRIDICASDFKTGKLHITHLAKAQQLNNSGLGIFIDLVVSEKCAIMISTSGLYRIGNGQDIRSDSIETLNWVPLTLYDKAGPAIALIPISTTGRPQDVAREAGQLYAISGSIGKNTARLHRFAVSSVINKPITDDTTMPLRDFIAEKHQSYFANIGNFSSFFATDGSLFFTQGMQRRKKMKTQIINNDFGRTRCAMPLRLSNDAVITCIARNSASGNWMIGGDFGLIVNE